MSKQRDYDRKRMKAKARRAEASKRRQNKPNEHWPTMPTSFMTGGGK